MANFKLRQTGEQIQKDLDKIENDALVKPASAPPATSILAVDSTNTQTMLAVGNGLNVENGELKVTTAVKQTTGQSTTAVMSQKASTDIFASKIDLATKLPKNPIEWEQWTAEEQAAARERIGASKKLGIWEDIATVNITEDVAAITVNLDANGNTLSLSDIICEIKIPAENPVKQRSIYFGLKTLANFTFSRTALTTNESYISGAITYARIVSGRVICDGAISGPSNTRHQPYYKYAIFNGYGGIEAESFDSVSVFTYNDSFPAGTTVILKGIRT